MRRARFDGLATANEQLTRELEHELRHFDARAGVYATSRRVFQLFVERCEAASLRANEAVSEREG
jgi:hypothetical protein